MRHDASRSSEFHEDTRRPRRIEEGEIKRTVLKCRNNPVRHLLRRQRRVKHLALHPKLRQEPDQVTRHHAARRMEKRTRRGVEPIRRKGRQRIDLSLGGENPRKPMGAGFGGGRFTHGKRQGFASATAPGQGADSIGAGQEDGLIRIKVDLRPVVIADLHEGRQQAVMAAGGKPLRRFFAIRCWTRHKDPHELSDRRAGVHEFFEEIRPGRVAKALTGTPTDEGGVRNGSAFARAEALAAVGAEELAE